MKPHWHYTIMWPGRDGESRHPVEHIEYGEEFTIKPIGPAFERHIRYCESEGCEYSQDPKASAVAALQKAARISSELAKIAYDNTPKEY